jgi:hypothetical protein
VCASFFCTAVFMYILGAKKYGCGALVFDAEITGK